MLNRIKAQAKKTAQFAKNHPTVVACGITAVVTARVVHRYDTGVIESQLVGLTQLAYDAGYRVGELEEGVGQMYEFVVEKGLSEEFVERFPKPLV